MDNTFFPENDYRTYLSHGGPGSGRYPKGSGKNPFQHVPGRKHYTTIRGGPEVKARSKPAKVDTADAEDVSKWFAPKYKAGKDKPLMSAAERTMSTSDKIIQNSTAMVNAARTLKGRKQSAASELSDEELTAALKRLRMEAEFDRLTTADTSDGFDKAVSILSMAGSAIGIVGGVVTIMSTIQDMKK